MPDPRTEISRAVAKAFAYKAAGKDTTASEWADKAIELLNKTFPPSPFNKRPKGSPPL